MYRHSDSVQWKHHSHYQSKQGKSPEFFLCLEFQCLSFCFDHLRHIPNASIVDCPDELLCTEEEVFDLLSGLDCSKANGHDDISARMLKETATSITSAVTELFNISIRCGEIPTEWKTARVTPIPKGATPSNPANYRPISLLSVLSKLLEMHIRNVLLDHF